MIEALESRRGAIADICQDFQVKRLDVFGSAASSEDHDPHRSDVDFVVEFEEGVDLGPWLTRYHEFREALEKLLDRRVDLVMAGAPRNPYFIRELERTRQSVYASKDRKVS